MHTLPKLVLSGDEFRLPLADPSAQRLAAALISTDSTRRREQFRAAVVGDPALAVWSLVKAHRNGQDDLHTCGQLASWLDAQPVGLLCPEEAVDCDVDDSPIAEFVEPAGCSLAAAELAVLFARHVGADSDRAQLLALVHLAKAWLCESGTHDDAAHSAEQSLPCWLQEAVAKLHQPADRHPAEINCVARAIDLVCCETADTWRAMGCDATYWIGRWAVLGQHWGTIGPWAAHLAELTKRLAQFETLQTHFDRALETAKLEAMKELAYGAGHEINNPLANISARAQTLLQNETDPERRRTLAAINAQAFRAHEMIADMMLFARPPEPKREPCDPASIVRTLIAELENQAAQQQVTITFQPPGEPLAIAADATQLAVAIRSLLVNSLEAMTGGGCIAISLHGPTPNDSHTRIEVVDDGPGIPPEIRPKIFDPFFSGREAGRGLGLGLSKCWRIVTLHGGQIDVKSNAERGAHFTIRLPN